MGRPAEELTAEQELKMAEDAFMAGADAVIEEVVADSDEVVKELVEDEVQAEDIDDQVATEVVQSEGDSSEKEGEDSLEEPAGQTSEESVLGGIPDAVIEKIEAALMKKIGRRLHNLEGNVGGFSQKLELMQEAGKKKITEEKPEKTDSAEMAMLREDLPELATAFDHQADQNNKLFVKSEERLSQAGEEIQQLRSMRQLDGSFPDWETTIKSEHYQNWLMNQSREYIDVAVNSKDVNDAVQVLSHYRDDHRPLDDRDADRDEPGPTKNNNLLADAIAPTRGTGVSTRRRKTAQEEFDAA